MNRIGVMAYANLGAWGGDYALDIHADRFPVLIGCTVRSDAPVRHPIINRPERTETPNDRRAAALVSELKRTFGPIAPLHEYNPGETYIRDMPALWVDKPAKYFFHVKATFPWPNFEFSKSDAQIKFALWGDETFTKPLWDMEWIHTFAGLEKWNGEDLPRPERGSRS